MQAATLACTPDRYCPRCGMRYLIKDGVMYPQSHNLNSVCDACHLEEVMNSITTRKGDTVHSMIRQYNETRQAGMTIIPERKRRLIASVSETIGKFSISRQEIGAVIDLHADVETAKELSEEGNQEEESVQKAAQRLEDYLFNLGDHKRRELMCMMLLGRNLDYYGLCQDAVIEFRLRSQDPGGRFGAKELACKRRLGEWIRLVLDLIES